MIVGFSKYGTGSARAAVKYLTGPTNPDGTQRQPVPMVLRGEPEFLLRLCDSLPFEKKYKSGVLSFAPGEVITPAMEQAIMDEFERVAFAGLDRDQYAILWVRHSHAQHHELNFLIPRVELTSLRSLNIDPPGKQSQQLFDTFRSMINAEYGLADPDDPARARDVSVPNHLAKQQATDKRRGNARKADLRETITEAIRQEADAGRITDRTGVECYLLAQGYEIPRTGKDYLTVLIPATGERVRLKGGLYQRDDWQAGERPTPVCYNVPDPERAAALAATLEAMAATRAAYHQQRYGRQRGDTPERTPDPDLDTHLRQELGDETIDPPDPKQPSPSRQKRERRRRTARAIAEEDKTYGQRPALPTVHDVRALLERARHRYADALAHLDRATRRYHRTAYRFAAGHRRFVAARQGIAAALTADLEREWWERFYGHER